MILSISRDASEEVIAILRTNEGDRELLRSTLGEEKKKLVKGGKENENESYFLSYSSLLSLFSSFPEFYIMQI